MNSTTLFRSLALILSSLLVGCAIAIPVHEGEIAETLGEDVVKIQAGYVQSPAVYVQPNNDTTGDNDETEDYLFLAFKYGIQKRLDGEFAYMSGDSYSGYRLGIKYMWLGDRNYFQKESETNLNKFSASIALRASFMDGGNTDAKLGDTTYYFDNIEGEVTELSLPFGYRLGDAVSLYAGPKVSYINMESQYGLDADTRKEFTANRHFEAYTVFAGIGFLAPRTNNLDAQLEVFTTSMEGTHNTDRITYHGYLLSVGYVFDRSPDPILPPYSTPETKALSDNIESEKDKTETKKKLPKK